MKKLYLLIAILSLFFTIGNCADITQEQSDGSVLTAAEFNKLITTREGHLKPINTSETYDTTGTYNIGTTTSPWGGIALASGGTQEILKIKYFSYSTSGLTNGTNKAMNTHGIAAGKVRGVVAGMCSADYATGGTNECAIIFWVDDTYAWVRNIGGITIDDGNVIKGYVIYAE